MFLWPLTLTTAYLLGSIPNGYLLVRFFRKEDIRAIGSGNIGATNVARSGAKGLGILTLILDALKAAAAVLLAQHLLPNNPDIPALAAVFAILGHMFPVWLGFKGGKGVASALGVYLALSWPTALASLAVFIIVLLLSKYVSLASLVGAAVLPVACVRAVESLLVDGHHGLELSDGRPGLGHGPALDRGGHHRS